MVVTTKEIPKIATSPKKGAGTFARKAVLLTTLTIASLSLSGQIKQVYSPTDTLNDSFASGTTHLARSEYVSMKKQQNQTPARLELIGIFVAFIKENPTHEFSITKALTLSVEEQKTLRKEHLLETDKHVLYYIFEVDGVFNGYLWAFRKKQPTVAPPDTLK